MTEKPFRCRAPLCVPPPPNCSSRFEYKQINGVLCPVACTLKCDGPVGELSHQP